MKNKFKYYLFFIVVIFIVGCKKDPPTISTTPEIAFTSISPGTAKEFQDEINITFTYKDGDGDIGENNADAKNLFVTDSRNGVVYKYRIQELAPAGSSIAIKGSLNVTITNTAITDVSNSQSVAYSIYIVDRAGHQSNVITTSATAIIK